MIRSWNNTHGGLEQTSDVHYESSVLLKLNYFVLIELIITLSSVSM